MEEAAVLEKHSPQGVAKVDTLKPLTSRQKYKAEVPSTKSLETSAFPRRK